MVLSTLGCIYTTYTDLFVLGDTPLSTAHQLCICMLQVLERCLKSAGDVGVIHLALQSNQHGLVLQWQSSLLTLLDTGKQNQ